MCGLVAGILQRPVDLPSIDRAIASLHHRGPDSAGKWTSPDRRMFLGFARLSIIGLENGDQPISNAAGDVQLVANAEFYGYKKIREQLISQGCKFKTDSDCEIALHLYLRHGMGLAPHLRGEFAGVIADTRNKAMLAIRDRFGIKPLFYAVKDGNVFFASEIKALLALGVSARWDKEAVFQETFLFRPHARTLFAGIFTVPPGHYAIAQNGNVSLYPYWDLEFPTRERLLADDRSDEEVVRGFRAVLDDAVKERLVADVEVAAYLSGGIDSCAVLGLAQRHMSRPIRAFTLAFDDAAYDESALAQKQAEHSGASFCPIPVTSRALADAYSDAVWHAETPFINGHGVAKFLLSRGVRDAGIKVVFTGEGSDEMLAGYPPFRRDVLLYNSATQDPETVKRLLAQLREANKAVPSLVTQEGSPDPSLEAVQRRLGWVPSWIQTFAQRGSRVRDLLSRDMKSAIDGVNPYEIALNRLTIDARLTGRDPLNQALYLWSKIHLPNFILTFLSDRMEMAHSIEGRVPFLDHHVAEFATGIPIHMKINGMREKHVLREAARDVLIEPVYNRAKHPFTTPPAKIGQNDAMLAFFGDVLGSSMLRDQPIFDVGAARQLFENFFAQTPEERTFTDGTLHQITSLTIMNQRFGMSY
jgi:asparagine synthase (glutamine-hydrolysing)